ncbi:MAG: alpha/beta hydrolase [Cyanobacteria bacterium P01_H01_bin.119]
MQSFQPIGFSQQWLPTPLGNMAYYTPTENQPGSASPDSPLVFIHSLGGGSSAYEWSHVYPAFAADYQVIAPDLLGWGDSDHPERTYRVSDYLDSLAQLLETVAAAPAVVMATSLTASIVIRLAIKRPELFHQLFLVSPSGYGDFGRDYRLSIAAQLAGTPGVDRWIYALGAANELAVTSFLANFLFHNPARITPEMVNAYLASTQKPKAEYAALASLKGDLCCDLARYMGQLTVPTAFVWGEYSRFSAIDVGRRLAKLTPQVVQLYSVKDAGVLPHLEQPAVVTGLLRGFLKQTAD